MTNLRFDFNRLLITITFVAVFTMAVRFPADSDTWWHLKAGQVMWQSKTILTTDLFSHTRAGSLWIDHGWLAQLGWYGLFRLAGLPGLSLGLAAIVTAAFGLVWRQSEGNLYVRAFGVVLGAITSSIIWAVRPQIISFLFAALALWGLDRFRQKRGQLLPWFPLLVLMWVNTHGGFAIAFILLGCYAAGGMFNQLTGQPPIFTRQQWRHLAITAVISLAVVAINPHTWRLWLYPFQTVGIGVLRSFIAEWQSPNFHQPILLPFLLILLLIILAIARAGKPMDWIELALLGAWITLSLLATRNVAIFTLVGTPILIKYGTLALEAQFGPLKLGNPRPLPPLFYRLNGMLLALVLTASLLQIAVTLSPLAMQKTEAEQFPSAAADFIQQTQPPGPLFNSYNFGGYLIYRLWPDYSVFVDGRTDLYDDDFLRDYLNLANALPGWESDLNRQKINLVVVEPNSPPALTLANQSAWQQTFADKLAVVFERR